MSQALVHYEVFARARPSSPWSLQLATEERQNALDTAEEMMATGHACAVRVSRETLDDETGEFKSLNILTKGALAGAPKARPAREAENPLCVSPDDLYTAHARDRISRLLDGWLRRHHVTAFELLHRADLVEKLETGGLDLQHAIQKVAIPEAQARGATTHEMIRTFQKLADRAVERVITDAKAERFPTLHPSSFAGAVEMLLDRPDRGYLLGGGVSAYLAPADRWSAKIARLLDLADGAPAAGKARAAALGVLQQPLAEILTTHGALADLVGPGSDLGATLAALTRLAASDSVDQILSFEPRLQRCFLPLTPEAERLSLWLRDEAFEMVRVGIGRRVLKELKGPKRLRPAVPDEEILLLRGLAMALTAAAGRLISAGDVQEAFVERSRALLGGDFVNSYLEGRESALGEAHALVRLAENVAGSLNKKTASQWIGASVSTLRFERELREGAEPPASRLAALAALQRAVAHAGLPESDMGAIQRSLGKIGGLLEADTRLVALICRSQASRVQKLAALLRMASGEAAPIGPAADLARGEAMKLLRDPAVRAEVAREETHRDLIRDLLGRANVAA